MSPMPIASATLAPQPSEHRRERRLATARLACHEHAADVDAARSMPRSSAASRSVAA